MFSITAQIAATFQALSSKMETVFYAFSPAYKAEDVVTFHPKS